MALKITFQKFETETIKKGKGPGYEQGVVSYTYNGEGRTQKMVSFSNPAVFGQLKTFKEGDVLLVDITKNDSGYNQWSGVALEGSQKAAGAPQAAAAGVRVAGSNYETPEERKQRQLLIVRQSSLGHAIETLKSSGAPFTLEDAFPIAAQAVRWVYGEDIGDDNPEVGQE